MADYLQYEERAERRIDSDLVSALEYNGLAHHLPEFSYVLAAVYGANEESNWHWLIALKDGTYAYVSGGCDYTGWDCQSSAEVLPFLTLKEAINAIPEIDDYAQRKPRSILKKQLVGTVHYGCES